MGEDDVVHASFHNSSFTSSASSSLLTLHLASHSRPFQRKNPLAPSSVNPVASSVRYSSRVDHPLPDPPLPFSESPDDKGYSAC